MPDELGAPEVAFDVKLRAEKCQAELRHQSFRSIGLGTETAGKLTVDSSPLRLLATYFMNVTLFSNATIKNYSENMTIRIPAPWEPHSCCWMAWAVHSEWADWAHVVKAELEAVIQSISQYELVRLLTPLAELADARARFSGGNVEIIEAPVDDIWMRDIAPTFALSDNEIIGIDWNFKSWGGTKERPFRKGDLIASKTQQIFGVPRLQTPIVAEGGALITDGQGTLITTRSCLLHPTRNPVHKNYDRKTAIEKELLRLGMGMSRSMLKLEGRRCSP